MDNSALISALKVECEKLLKTYKDEALKIPAFKSVKQKVTKTDIDKLGDVFLRYTNELDKMCDNSPAENPDLSHYIDTVFKHYSTLFLEFTRKLQGK
ncbi:hypothetical protein GR160_03020 [Flavobacterium sp. Sd200]|uniref:hypothetical protein n=1 Tax=Flavobacterium sp. Sd200 TaxID=2692211 RepID=UPI001370EAED|nr:hypothetical protein [Flavobacterium sp. Sd200]MXN90186.1 hypothetical protein [Flavobacterium sp. Sd200]